MEEEEAEEVAAAMEERVAMARELVQALVVL